MSVLAMNRIKSIMVNNWPWGSAIGLSKRVGGEWTVFLGPQNLASFERSGFVFGRWNLIHLFFSGFLLAWNKYPGDPNKFRKFPQHTPLREPQKSHDYVWTNALAQTQTIVSAMIFLWGHLEEEPPLERKTRQRHVQHLVRYLKFRNPQLYG